MEGIQEIEIAQQRLRLALKKVRGNMKAHSAMGDALTGMKQGDHASRIKLRTLIGELKRQLTQIDDRLAAQFKFEDATRSAIPESERYERDLQQEKSILVCAGEVSSGKSTLLNLILGQDILPAKRLSCTFTVCELLYDTTRKACVLFGDDEKEIPFEDRESYIYKRSSRNKQFPHSGVRLSLPVEMLQSGIKLVDTPGVGADSTTEELVLNYVRRNDVFGFIFTINAFDSGGVRLKFKKLLQDLSAIEDADKHRKLKPSSVLCVVNFWDKVPDDEKKNTRKQIKYYLKNMPFMETFDPEKQIFFMDSQGAMESLMLDAHLITEDFEQLIDGIREFFPVGQKCKLETPYWWLRNVLERLIHPVKTFLVRHKSGDRSSEISQNIEAAHQQFKIVITEAYKKHKYSWSELSKKLLKSMQDQQHKVLTWKTADIPSKHPDKSWSTFEESLDKAIDDRISQVIVEVEEEHRYISAAYDDLAHEVDILLNKVFNLLSDIERALRYSFSRRMKRRDINSIGINKRSEVSRIEVTIGRVQGAELTVPKFTSKNMFERLIYGPTIAIFGPTQQQRRRAIEQEIEKFNSNPRQFMSDRAKIIYKHFCTKENIDEIAKQELAKIEEYIKINEAAIPEQIESNKALLKCITEIATEAHKNDSKYRAFLEEMQKLYDELLLLGRESIVADTFKQADIKPFQRKTRKSNIIDASMPQHFSEAILTTPTQTENVTLIEFNTSPSCVIRYRETDKYDHQENLRQRSAHDRAPSYLGTCNAGRTFVLQGHFITARGQASKRIPVIVMEWQNRIGSYMTLLGDLGRALNEIHLRKIAHCILSLDTLLQGHKEDYSVRLANLFELATIQINENEDLQTGQLIYLAPEILFGDQKLYTTAADVYALGLIMIELWYRYDVFHDLKNQNFVQFKANYKENTGQLLLDEAERVMRETKQTNDRTIVIEMPEKYKTLIYDCLKNETDGRIDMDTWLDVWRSHRDDIEAKAQEGISSEYTFNQEIE